MDRHLYCQLVLRHVRGHKPGILLPWLAKKSAEGTTVILLDVDPYLASQRINARDEDEESVEYLQAKTNRIPSFGRTQRLVGT